MSAQRGFTPVLLLLLVVGSILALTGGALPFTGDTNSSNKTSKPRSKKKLI